MESEGYDEEEDAGIKDVSIQAEALPPDIQAIIANIQAQASTVAVLQLASGVQQAGRQPQGRDTRQRTATYIQAPEATP